MISIRKLTVIIMLGIVLLLIMGCSASEKSYEDGVGPFKGYWLKDTMACHFTDTYVACALAESDFITYEEIIEVNLISDTQIELTFEGDVKNNFRLLDKNTLELADGVYDRVSAGEANAIYGGHYTLP